MEKIGMIGSGAMGLALLERLKVAGVNAVCYDAYAPALEQAGALGMRTVGSSAEVAAESTLIDIVVRTDEDMIDCVIGAHGVLASHRRGSVARAPCRVAAHAEQITVTPAFCSAVRRTNDDSWRRAIAIRRAFAVT